MDIDELQLLLKEGEGLTVEFKESFSSKLDKDMVAFANTHGGCIFLGVNDGGKIVGEILTNDLKAKISSLARNCEPAVVLKSIEQVDKVIVVSIQESDDKPHSCSVGYFRRLDAATQKMNQKELKLLFDASNSKPKFEELLSDEITWDDLSVLKIRKFLSEAKIKIDEVDSNKLLSSLHLAKKTRLITREFCFFLKNLEIFFYNAK